MREVSILGYYLGLLSVMFYSFLFLQIIFGLIFFLSCNMQFHFREYL